MGCCLNRQTLERYLQQACLPEEVEAVRAHLAQCERCRALVEATRGAGPPATQDSPVPEEAGRPPTAVPPATQGDVQVTQTLPAPGARDAGGRLRPTIPGVSFEGYLLLEEIGQGGQGRVFKAVHQATNKKVALKMLIPGGLVSAEKRWRFEQEAAVLARLDHPNIVSIRDSGIAHRQYYFTMEYLRGQPLDLYVRSRTPSLRDKLALFAKVCDAVDYAHQKLVIHRDLKPSNILVDERGEPHILDFGVAKITAGLDTQAPLARMTLTTDRMGTAAYMSPEQAAGRQDLVDFRTDVYSLGIVLYEMCTGQLPYEISEENIQHAEPVRPRRLVRGFDSDVEAILLMCLAKDRSRRYQSAAELKRDVQLWLDGGAIMAKSVSSWYVLRKCVVRHRRVALTLGSLLLILGSFGSILAHVRRTAGAERRRADQIGNEARRNSEQQMIVLRQIAFRNFLEQWHQSSAAAQKAQFFSSFIPSGFQERKVADFLLDPAAAQHLPAFRQSLEPNARWWADLAEAEICLKQKSHADALASYLRCRRALLALQRDSVLKEYVEAKLYQLTCDRESAPTPAPQAGTKDEP